MSDIAPLGHSAKTTYAPPQRQAGASPAAPAISRGRDQADFSAAAQMRSKLQSLPDVREDLVNRVRSEIEAGTYETPEKLDQAMKGLAADLTA